MSPAQASSAAALAVGTAALLPLQHSAAIMALMSSQPSLLVEGTAAVTDAYSLSLQLPDRVRDVDTEDCEDYVAGLDAEDLVVDAVGDPASPGGLARALAAATLGHGSAALPQQLSCEQRTWLSSRRARAGVWEVAGCAWACQAQAGRQGRPFRGCHPGKLPKAGGLRPPTFGRCFPDPRGCPDF